MQPRIFHLNTINIAGGIQVIKMINIQIIKRTKNLNKRVLYKK